MVVGAGIAVKTAIRAAKTSLPRSFLTVYFFPFLALCVCSICYYQIQLIYSRLIVFFNLLQGCVFIIKTTIWRKSHTDRFWCKKKKKSPFLFYSALFKGDMFLNVEWQARLWMSPSCDWWCLWEEEWYFPQPAYKEAWPVTLTQSLGNCWYLFGFPIICSLPWALRTQWFCLMVEL